MKIYEIFGRDAHSMTFSLMEAADVASRIPENAAIVLKPNLVLDSSPENGATTHAGVLSGCLEYLLSHGFQNVCISESSWVGANTDRSFRACGYDRVCEKYNVPFYDLKKESSELVDTPFRPMSISSRILSADYLIDLPVKDTGNGWQVQIPDKTWDIIADCRTRNNYSNGESGKRGDDTSSCKPNYRNNGQSNSQPTNHSEFQTICQYDAWKQETDGNRNRQLP